MWNVIKLIVKVSRLERDFGVWRMMNSHSYLFKFSLRENENSVLVASKTLF